MFRALSLILVAAALNGASADERTAVPKLEPLTGWPPTAEYVWKYQTASDQLMRAVLPVWSEASILSVSPSLIKQKQDLCDLFYDIERIFGSLDETPPEHVEFAKALESMMPLYQLVPVRRRTFRYKEDDLDRDLFQLATRSFPHIARLARSLMKGTFEGSEKEFKEVKAIKEWLLTRWSVVKEESWEEQFSFFHRLQSIPFNDEQLYNSLKLLTTGQLLTGMLNRGQPKQEL
ncbi:hypothetical protein AAVH_43357 [Aphelenchoides avenae]|nr:hypothetical protein AAVH_43357 [Aphelenchus avenae]